VKVKASAIRANSRRRFLKTGAVVVPGLVIGFYLPERSVAPVVPAAKAPAIFAPNAFLRIGPDNTVIVISKHIEVGQGAYTGLATVLAEELDAAWSQVRVEAAPAEDNLYKNLLLGMQATCCSNSMMDAFEQYRQAGAMARAM
jgi:isoquinoline 1-oxidoreductase subunit beta